MAANMYRVGDYVFFETSSSAPYQIRRLEELNKTSSGNVEAKVMCFFRRRDISASLIALADRHQDGSGHIMGGCDDVAGDCGGSEETQPAVDQDRSSGSSLARALATRLHQLRQRELFLSRQVETLSATQIRGKCSVTLLNEAETADSYIGTENAFFYSLVYDLQQKTLVADRGDIRVGSRYQAEVPVAAEGSSERQCCHSETLTWQPNHSLDDPTIDRYLLVAKSVGTFARALDCSSALKQPSLHMSAAAASRDVTLSHAMDVLHQCDYDVGRAVTRLAPSDGPVLCRDEMEEWSASEANLFEEALEKYGKDFSDIRQDYLPWKSHSQLVEYYYMWKTTDRYVQQKRVKAAETECQLKQVYIPNYSKSSAAAAQLTNGRLSNGAAQSTSGRPCAGCGECRSSQWFAWGAPHMGDRLCGACWDYWKKYGGVRQPTISEEPESLQLSGSAVSASSCSTSMVPGLQQQQQQRCPCCSNLFSHRGQLIRHAASAHGLLLPGTGSSRPVTRTRPSFHVQSMPLARLARYCCSRAGSLEARSLRLAARRPTLAISYTVAREHCEKLLAEQTEEESRRLLTRLCGKRQQRLRPALTEVSTRLIGHQLERPSWMPPASLTAAHKHIQPVRLAFPPPPRAPDGSIVYTPVDSRIQLNSGVTLVRKRGHDETNGVSHESASKRPCDIVSITPIQPSNTQTHGRLNHVNGGRNKLAAVTRICGGRQKVISLSDAPDDVLHVANPGLRKMRALLNVSVLYRAARKPWRTLSPLAYQALFDLQASRKQI